MTSYYNPFFIVRAIVRCEEEDYFYRHDFGDVETAFYHIEQVINIPFFMWVSHVPNTWIAEKYRVSLSIIKR